MIAVPGTPITRAGKTIPRSKNPSNPWVGNIGILRASTSNSTGAVRNTGIDCPNKVSPIARESLYVPCL